MYDGVIFSDAGAEGLPCALALPASIMEEVVCVTDWLSGDHLMSL
jgi:hypothetical protein